MIDKRQREQTAQPVEKIVLMGGSFNPPTLAHQKILLAAMEALGADRGLFVPSSHGYVQNKMEKLGQPQDVFSEQLRLEMLRAMAVEDSRLAVEDMEFHRTGKAYTYETMEALQNCISWRAGTRWRSSPDGTASRSFWNGFPSSLSAETAKTPRRPSRPIPF